MHEQITFLWRYFTLKITLGIKKVALKVFINSIHIRNNMQPIIGQPTTKKIFYNRGLGIVFSVFKYKTMRFTRKLCIIHRTNGILFQVAVRMWDCKTNFVFDIPKNLWNDFKARCNFLYTATPNLRKLSAHAHRSKITS